MKGIYGRTQKKRLGVRTIEDKDITVIEVSEEERRDLREKLQPIYDRYCLDYMDIIEKIEKNQE